MREKFEFFFLNNLKRVFTQTDLDGGIYINCNEYVIGNNAN